MFSMLDTEQTKPESEDPAEADAMERFEEHVLKAVSEAAKMTVDVIAIKMAERTGLSVDVATFDGPNKDELSKEIHRKTLGRDREE